MREPAPQPENRVRGHCPWPLLVSSVSAVLIACSFAVAAGAAVSVSKVGDVGYPDSATLFVVRELLRSGHMYLGVDSPPYLVTLYGPLTYGVLAIPYALFEAVGASPIAGVRLALCGAVLLCVLVLFLISRRAFGPVSVAWLSVLFAMSVPPIAEWATQVRGDFLGLLFALLSVYVFLLSHRRSLPLGAAACAGVAMLFKQTFVAAPVTILLWLLFKRQWKQALLWAGGVALVVGGIHLVTLWREPAMLEHLMRLRTPVFEYVGAVSLVLLAVSMPPVPFAILGLIVARRNGSEEQHLLSLYCVVAWLVALATIPQAGGNINYFWEPLFASAVFAGPGIREIQRQIGRAKVSTQLVASAFCMVILLPSVFQPYVDTLEQAYQQVRDRHGRQASWHLFASVVSGRRLLSTFPDVTILGRFPEMPDPYLNAVLERRGRWSSAPVVADIAAGHYDLIVIRRGEADARVRAENSSRGVQLWSDAMWQAVTSSYTLTCVFEERELWLPRQRPDGMLLDALGCGF